MLGLNKNRTGVDLLAIGEIARTLRTIRHLRARQLARLIYRRCRPVTPVKATANATTTLRPGVSLLPRPRNARLGWNGSWIFAFFGMERTFSPASLDWHPTDVSRLWRYNLQYFDYLLDDGCPIGARDALLDHWIATNPPGTRDAWEAYPTSLRIVNWIDYLLRTAGARPPKALWLRSLFEQASWLEHNVEHHILANHLFKNGVALVFAGAFFEGPDAERWLEAGTRILERGIAEQFLPDGGHFERSPMYHCIVTQDVLDVVNLLQSTPSVPSGLLPIFENKVPAALAFLDGILHPDGDIPLFNDSAFGIALPPADLRAYAERVLGAEAMPTPSAEELRVSGFPQTGYFVCRHSDDHLIVDCGPIGPDYQPGHAHCDTLSFELSIDGERVIVDSGVSGYEGDPLRRYVRSTAAHNTVRVNEIEQSEVWGTFRVGRRARPLYTRITKVSDVELVFEGAHDGYRYLPQRLVHTRTIHYRPNERAWRIHDWLDGTGEATIEGYLHFSPKAEVTRAGRTINVRLPNWPGGLWITLTGWDDLRIERSVYCPRFGLRQDNASLTLRWRTRLPAEARCDLVVHGYI